MPYNLSSGSRSTMSRRQHEFWHKVVILVVGAIIIFVMVMLFRLLETIRATIAFADHNVTAFTGGAGNAWCEITVGYLMLSAIIAFGAYFDELYKKAIPPKKYKIKRRRPAPKPQIRFNRRVIFFVWLAVFVILLLFSIFFGFNGRECLHNDGSIHVYNAVNRETAVYSIGDIEEIELSIRRLSTGKHSHRWTFGFHLYTDSGERFWYEYRDFRQADIGGISGGLYGIERMLWVYSYIPVRITGTENFDSVTDYLELSDAQREMLGRIFGLI